MTQTPEKKLMIPTKCRRSRLDTIHNLIIYVIDSKNINLGYRTTVTCVVYVTINGRPKNSKVINSFLVG